MSLVVFLCFFSLTIMIHITSKTQIVPHVSRQTHFPVVFSKLPFTKFKKQPTFPLADSRVNGHNITVGDVGGGGGGVAGDALLLIPWKHAAHDCVTAIFICSRS